MNREILFRGKDRKGRWIEGYFCPCSFGRFPCKPAIVSAEKLEQGAWEPVEVDPETVGQYTGLTDKNGKKIFEGDIVEGLDFTAEDGGYGVVTFDDGAFEVVGSCDNNIVGTFHENYYGKDFEVIGNIHDNPELLKGEQT